MSTKHQKVEIKIPEEYPKEVAEVIAQEIVDFMKERTLDGKDWRGKDLPAYSKSYVNSLDFENAGKSADEVNFTQSGDTLTALDVLEVDRGKVVIGWQEGSKENAIADGNIRGTYGNSKTVGPKREVLGIREKDLNKILEEFPLNNQDELDMQIRAYLFSKKESKKYGNVK